MPFYKNYTEMDEWTEIVFTIAIDYVLESYYYICTKMTTKQANDIKLCDAI